MSPTRTESPLAWDPISEEYKDDPHAVWRLLRDEAPVYYNPAHDFYALSRFVDVDAAHRDPRTFSSAHGTVLEIMGPDIIGGMMIFTDPPDHTRLRRLVSKAFTPRRMAVLEGEIRDALRRPPRPADRQWDLRLRAGLRRPRSGDRHRRSPRRRAGSPRGDA